MFQVGQDVVDKAEDGLGKGKVVDIYINYHDDPGGVRMYIVHFGFDQYFDRLESEIV